MPMSLMVAERPKGVDSERALATLWERAASLPDGLTTQDGRRYWVNYPGRPNPRAGPDFLDARLRTESGQTVIGDVELHLNAPDWYGHGHHSDPNYNGVVLHVVLSARGHSTTSQHSKMRVPVASLQGFLGELGEAGQLEPAAPQDLAELNAELDLAGDERFLSRSRGFFLEFKQSAPDQVIYRSLMEALGYASNRKPFRQLADRVPFSALATLKDEPRSTRGMAIHAALLSASGLASLVKSDPQKQELIRLARRLPRHLTLNTTGAGPLSQDGWRLFRVRPHNHPLRRLQGAVRILEGCLRAGLARHLSDVLIRDGAGGIEKEFLVKPYIGAGRARDIAVNVALPFLHALGHLEPGEGLTSLALSSYRRSPGLAENEITREMRKLTGMPSKSRISARRHQGLMHLYRTGYRTALERPLAPGK